MSRTTSTLLVSHLRRTPVTARVRSPTNDRRRAVTNDVGAVLKSPDGCGEEDCGGGGEGEEGIGTRLEYAPASVPVKMLLTSPVRASPSVLSSTPARSVFDCTDCDRIDGDGGVSSSCCCMLLLS
ncbi:hypothetical protein BGY98DRAFT_936787 [Russula aff. rugulosa BPL654]|nr:hypothetical protein BGY98DRAFT_936787 [Russula aff. rugulosa BPL654]